MKGIFVATCQHLDTGGPQVVCEPTCWWLGSPDVRNTRHFNIKAGARQLVCVCRVAVGAADKLSIEMSETRRLLTSGENY